MKTPDKVTGNIIGLFLLIHAPAYAAELTPEYLHGEWCFEYMQAGEQKEQESKNWVFAEGGKFLASRNDFNKSPEPAGSWDIKDDKLQIKPRYMGGHKPVEIVSPDKFIFKWMFGADMHVARGKCK
jgi:hypothetical protein